MVNQEAGDVLQYGTLVTGKVQVISGSGGDPGETIANWGVRMNGKMDQLHGARCSMQVCGEAQGIYWKLKRD